jgi:hypothetical protein
MITFLFSPVQFFERRLDRRHGWGLPLALPALCAALHAVATLIFAMKTRPLLDDAFAALGVPAVSLPPAQVYAVLAVFGYPITFAMAALALIALDVVVSDSGEARRLGQFAGLAFLSQVPYCAFMVLVAIAWTPAPLVLPSGASLADLQEVVNRYRHAAFDTPLMSTARLLSYYSVLWLSVMLAISWKVVSRVRLGPALAVGVFLLLLFGMMGGLSTST